MKDSFENCVEIVNPSDFEIVAQTHARLPHSFLTQIFLQLGVLKKKYMKLGSGKMVSPTCFEIITRTHIRVLYSCPRLMIVHFEEVRLSMNLENFMDTRRPACFEIVVRPPPWLIYSFLIQISLQSIVLKKKYMKLDVGKFLKTVS